MSDRRDDPEDITPKSEDWGIFKDSNVTVQLEVTPLRRETSRGDLLCAGYLDDARIEVVFPGRRREAAKTVEAELDRVFRAEKAAAQSRGLPMPHAINLRLPLAVEGTWRTRMVEAEEEEWERVYQFMVARWTFRDQHGQEISFGEPPIRRPVTRMPAF